MLLAGPAVRAVAAGAREAAMLAGPLGADAAAMLPGVDDVLVWRCPWIVADPPPVDRGDVDDLVARLRERAFERALVFTSFHQSPLPTALVLRMAGIPWVGAISEDYPGSLLDLRHRLPDDVPEAERALSLTTAAGFDLPMGDDGRLRVRGPLPDVRHLVGTGPYVVLHPGTSVPARAWPAARYAETARHLTAEGHRVVVTGAPSESSLTAEAAADVAVDLGGHTDLRQLAAVLAGAGAVVVGNTGPAHLAAAVGTPVVSLFAPTVPAVRWAPYGVPHVLLGDQQAPCRDTRARHCPVPGHPCLSEVTSDDVRQALGQLTAERAPSGSAVPSPEEVAS
ncbi:MAG: glycosyltransferase family 9 protein [Actinomycetota bacterium]|nr:glycosyltransferase family 9 protein [Actinomycetota bacterium]